MGYGYIAVNALNYVVNRYFAGVFFEEITALSSFLGVDKVICHASCLGNPGKMEYRGVWVADGSPIFKAGPFEDGTNNIGEFLAIVHALAWMEQQGVRFTICSDSRNAILWIKQKKCKTKLERTGRNDKVFELIARAERWLATHAITVPIVKWETKLWGEIPADFGRK